MDDDKHRTRELPQERNVHRRITYEMDTREPEEIRSIGGGEGAEELPTGGVRERHPGNEPVADATEVLAYCERCNEERRFVMQQVPVPPPEDESEPALVQDSVTGETGWVCQACGSFVRDPIDDGAYEYQYSNVGYEVPQFDDEEETIRGASAQGVEPPQRVHDRGTLVNPAEAARGEREGEGSSAQTAAGRRPSE